MKNRFASSRSNYVLICVYNLDWWTTPLVMKSKAVIIIPWYLHTNPHIWDTPYQSWNHSFITMKNHGEIMRMCVYAVLLYVSAITCCSLLTYDKRNFHAWVTLMKSEYECIPLSTNTVSTMALYPQKSRWWKCSRLRL